MNDTPERLVDALADRYRIERELGQGGMATVYLAEDLKHRRRVALKVLKPELAAVLGAERFVQEITTTAALQHPHILPLFDSGTADGFLYYVMPFIDGETLRAKLDRETQLDVEEAVKIATDVADALQYAHTHGVIHRDIKPENILLANGRPVVADFGIALAVSAAAGGRMTETGLSLGTPHYMSPEQATAEKEITARSDIYSLGSVLYEMLAGQPPHLGGSAQQIVMRIIAEPVQPVTQHRKSAPPNVAAAVAKALEKLPADRFESAKAFADALGNPAFRVKGGSEIGGTALAGTFSRRVIAFAAALVVLAIFGAAWSWPRTPPPPAPIRHTLALFAPSPGDAPWRNLALSPDGLSIAFAQAMGTERMIWLKTPDRAAAEPVAGTQGGQSPTFSPDGQWIAFVSDGRLRKVKRGGGDAVTLAEGIPSGTTSTAWLDNGTVLFSGPRFGLSAVSEDAGAARVVVSRDSLPNNVFDIAAVPGGRSALYVTCASNCQGATLWSVDLASGARRQLSDRAMRVWYVTGGIVAYVEARTGRAFAAPFDEKALTFRARPTPVIEAVRRTGGEGISMEVSANGTLLFLPAEGATVAQAVWVTRDGRITPVDSAWSFAPGGGTALSPDGRRVAVAVRTGATSDIWLKDVASGGAFTRLTFEGDGERPVWTPDGRSVVYARSYDATGPWDIRRRRIDGSDSAQTVLRHSRSYGSFALLRDTTQLLVRFGPPPTRDIYVARGVGAAAGDTLVPLLASDAYEEVAPSLSPDERWLAYASNESGQVEVYVVPFPNVKAGRWQVSLAGGRSPRWAHSGNELFYRDLADGVMAVPVTQGSSPVFGERRLLFRLDGMRRVGNSFDPMQTQFDVSPDDRRFLFLRALGGEDDRIATTAVLVQHWLTEVRARMKGAR